MSAHAVLYASSEAALCHENPASEQFFAQLDIAVRCALDGCECDATLASIHRRARACAEFMTGAYEEDCSALGIRRDPVALHHALVLGAAIGLQHALSCMPKGVAVASEALLCRILDLASGTAARLDGFSARAAHALCGVDRELAGYCDGYRATSPALELARLYEELLTWREPDRTSSAQHRPLCRERLHSPLDALTYARQFPHETHA